MIDKIFPRKLNRSKDARIQDKTEMYNAINVSIDDFDGSEGGADGTGDAGVIKPAKGNAAIPQPGDLISDGQHLRVIGSVADEVNNEVYLFVFSTVASEHGVYKITASEQLERVFTSEHFQFDDNGFVKGDIVYRQDGSVILYFTDGINEPRRLNLGKLSQADFDSASAAAKIDFITACPKTPMHPPTFEFSSDPSRAVNFRSVEGFQFAYQCIYEGGEESAISTYSNVAVPPPYLVQGSLSDPALEGANKIEVTVPTTVNDIENFTSNIVKIRLLVRIGNSGGFFVVSEKSPGDTFSFYNDSVLTGVPQEDQDKLNDALPRKAFAQTVVNDRLIYGNYEEGYETPSVEATFTTRNIERPEDFVDLRIGVRPLMAPVFDEDSAVTVSMSGEDFIPSGTSGKVFNRRAAYQFDLSELPSLLPSGSVAELSFSVEPDKNFEIYNSENSFHAFKNNGFGLSLDSSDVSAHETNIRVVTSDNAFNRGVDNGSPAVFQDQSPGVQTDGLTWTSTDPGAQQTTSNIKFGTSPSNPFIIPKEFIRFNLKFKVVNEVSGAQAVKNFIKDLLIGFFSEEQDVATASANALPAFDSIPDLIEGRTPQMVVDQLMDSPRGFGLISDRDPRSRTVVSCFSGDEAGDGFGSIAPCGFFAINKAKARVALRHSQKLNDAITDPELNVGPVFTLHIKDLEEVETVTMVPRITRSGDRGWIYLRKDFLETSPEDVRKVCVFDQDTFPTLNFDDTFFAPPVENDMNVFFLNDNFCPITSSEEASEANLENEQDYVSNHIIIPSNFLNAGDLVTTNVDLTELGNAAGTWRGFQDTEEPVVGLLYSPNGTELDSDFRVQGGSSSYPLSQVLSFGPHDEGVNTLNQTFPSCGDNVNKRRIIGYLDLNGASSPFKAQDPNNPNGIVHSIVDGETNIRRNGVGGRLNPSYWYGLYYGTEFAGRNNNQFLLVEGSTSDTPVGLLHGDFSYKSFSETEIPTIIDELIPDIEVGRKSFTLTTESVNVGAVGRSFKRNCDHSFAVLYYDERGRPGEPVPLGSHFVPQVSEPGLAHVIIKLTSSPPEWAHSYKILYGGNNSISDFVQYTAGGAFVPKNSDNEKGLIYVSLNYLQENTEISYSKAFGAVSPSGDKDLYTFSEGDRLRIVSYFNDPTDVQYPSIGDPYEFQVVGTVTLNDDSEQNPLVVEGDEVHPAKTGQFVIIKDNTNASGFSFADVAGSLSDQNTSVAVYDNSNYWNRRCVFEIYSPQKKREVESRIYHEIGKTYNVVRNSVSPEVPLHQTETILVDQGDVYFRKMAVNMQDFDEETNSFVGLIGDGTDTIDEATSPNFRSYHLESKAFTDTFPDADVLPYGKPRVAIEKFEPIRIGSFASSQGSSNHYKRHSSLKFSDRSNSNSNIVRYTSFNDSKLPYKDLQTSEGEVFFLVNYNDSIFCIQRLKCSSIPVERNILADALGNETVIATSKVLGTERYYAGRYGTDAPESVAQAGSAIYFVSTRNKEVYRFNPNSGIEVISDKGMGSFFDEILAPAEASDEARVVGGFDPDSDEFLISVWEAVIPLVSEGDIDFSNVVTTVIAEDFTGFEAEAAGTDIDINDNQAEVSNLLSQISGLTTFIENSDSSIEDLVGTISDIDSLLTTDFTSIAAGGETIQVNIAGSVQTIGPSSVPSVYVSALEALRAQVIGNIGSLMQSKIDSLVSLGVARNQVVQTYLNSVPLYNEAIQTFNQLQDAITALEAVGFPVVPDYLSQEERDELLALSNQVITPVVTIAQGTPVIGLDGTFVGAITPGGFAFSQGVLVEPSIDEIFDKILDLDPGLLAILGEGIVVPEIHDIAFVDDDLFNGYVNATQAVIPDFSSIPDISSLVPGIISAAAQNAANNVDITADNMTAEEIAEIEQRAYNDGYSAGEAAGIASVDITSDNDGVYQEGYDAGFEAGSSQSDDDLGLAEKRLNLITKSLFVLANAIDLLSGFAEDDLPNSFGASVNEFVSLLDAENQDLIESIDLAYQNIEDDEVSFLQEIFTIYDTSEGSSPFVSLMHNAIVSTIGAIPNENAIDDVAEFMAGNSDFLASSGIISQTTINEAIIGDKTNSERISSLQAIALTISGGLFPAVSFEGSGASTGSFNPSLLAEFLSAWVQIGQRINEQAPGTVDLSPSTPQGLLDANTTFTFVNENSEPVGEITFDQLVSIFRRGLISENQAKLIFKGLMGRGSLTIAGATTNLRATNTIHMFDANFDNEVGSADLLEFFAVLGQDVTSVDYNFQQFGNVAFGEDIGNGIVNIEPINDNLDSAPFLQEDVDNITGFN